VTLRQNLFVVGLFLAGVVLAHVEHRGMAVLVMAGACLAVLIAERGE
jgi:hypothetical protein